MPKATKKPKADKKPKKGKGKEPRTEAPTTTPPPTTTTLPPTTTTPPPTTTTEVYTEAGNAVTHHSTTVINVFYKNRLELVDEIFYWLCIV